MNIALFISGRIKCYKELNNFLQVLGKKYNIKLFASINKYSLDNEKDEEEFKEFYKNIIGDTYFDYFKIEKDVYEFANKNNNLFLFKRYNEQSCFWNDNKNFKMIEKYQKDNNIKFDIISKIRSEMEISNLDYNFIKDNEKDLIIRNKHICDIRYWGHIFKKIPILCSDAFAYGNYKSMEIYCNAYKFWKKEFFISNANYSPIFETLLTDSLLNYPCSKYKIMEKNKLVDLYKNNKIKFIIDNNFRYELKPVQIRSSKNFVVNESNYEKYVQI